MTIRRTAGITLLEMLVVLVIIAALMGLLIPAIQSTHTGYRRTECANNLKNLALAAIQYEVANGELPGYLHEFGTF